MKKKKIKNKKTKVDTSDYYTEVFSKGKKLKKISDKEKPILFEKSRENGVFAAAVFAIIMLILHFTTELGVGYWFFFMLGACVLFLIIWIILLILVALGIIRSFP